MALDVVFKVGRLEELRLEEVIAEHEMVTAGALGMTDGMLRKQAGLRS